MSADVVVYVVLVAVLWGGSNPLIRLASKNITEVQADSAIGRFLKEIFYLVTNWKYIVPFLLNQCGSVLYVYALQHAALSFIVPVTNSLTFIFTVICGWILGEERPNFDTLLGMGLVLTGTTICWFDKT
ncbi:transmembrane protein 234 homolog [Arctopsyche grandis]|uniref:transmembrane protein 234 homolog n=1 Tax=Arctopsyche grandis TaxID=121162 RepID=UPI00406D78E5